MASDIVWLESQKDMATTNTTTIKYGIRITHDRGPEGWVVGKDSDVMLFADKATATATLKKDEIR